MQFARLYVVVTLPGKEQIESFIQSYFKWVAKYIAPIDHGFAMTLIMKEQFSWDS